MRYLALALALASLLVAVSPAVAAPKLAVVSYWGVNTKNYWKIPDHGLALVNPASGILAGDGKSMALADDLDVFHDVFRRARSHDISLYGYVPTGYFNHGCNVFGQCQTWERIEAQLEAYAERMPDLAGVFFDETAPADWSCEAYTAEYQHLRDLAHRYLPGARLIFNLGMPDICAVAAAEPGETLVLFETDGAGYLGQSDKIAAATSAARTKGVKVWHIVNTVATESEMQAVVRTAQTYDPDYLYVVDVSGDWQAGYNTYGALPAYWAAEIEAINK